MALVHIVAAIALLQFIVFAMAVGWARTKFGVKAPATTGHEVFERYFRVQMNTLELLVVFLPSLWLFATYVSPRWAAGLGALYVIGRILYFRSYIRDPASRSAGFGLSFLPTIALLLGGLGGAVYCLIRNGAV